MSYTYPTLDGNQKCILAKADYSLFRFIKHWLAKLVKFWHISKKRTYWILRSSISAAKSSCAGFFLIGFNRDPKTCLSCFQLFGVNRDVCTLEFWLKCRLKTQPYDNKKNLFGVRTSVLGSKSFSPGSFFGVYFIIIFIISIFVAICLESKSRRSLIFLTIDDFFGLNAKTLSTREKFKTAAKSLSRVTVKVFSG